MNTSFISVISIQKWSDLASHRQKALISISTTRIESKFLYGFNAYTVWVCVFPSARVKAETTLYYSIILSNKLLLDCFWIIFSHIDRPTKKANTNHIIQTLEWEKPCVVYVQYMCVIKILAGNEEHLCEHAVLSCCPHVSLLKLPPCLIKVKNIRDSQLIQPAPFDPFPMQRSIPQSAPQSNW